MTGAGDARGATLDATAYLAPEGFEAELATELGEVSARYGRLLVTGGPPRPAAWAQNTWLAPERAGQRT